LILQLEKPTARKTRRYDSVLCFGDSDWWYHNRGHADMQFMRRFARRSRVVYVNSLGVKTPSVSEGRMFLRRVKRKLGSLSRFYRDGGEGFGVLTPVFVPFSGGWPARGARAALTLQLRSMLRVLRMRSPLIWVTCPTAAVVLSRLAHQGIVHQLSDCYGALKGGQSCAAVEAERQVAEQADLVICASERLLERARDLYGKGEYVDHGVDYELFAAAGRSANCPAELKGVKPPLIGFYGNMDGNTVDCRLLEAVCRLRPEYSFVLVGDMSAEFESLKSLPNVVAVPRQLYQRVAQFGASFNVCLMPWLENEWIEHCNPVKLKEYLALGKPVVSTPFPELRRSGSLCLRASGAEAFAAAIDRALRDDHPTEQDKRRAWASQHTWDEKFETVVALLRERGIEGDARG
jgi:glycosyltransferase involved in cell wall biosynthesis